MELNRATHSSVLRHEEGDSIVQVKRVESVLLYKKKKKHEALAAPVRVKGLITNQ